MDNPTAERIDLPEGYGTVERTMEWAAENGLTYFDFTIGDEPYKQELGGRPLELVEVVQAGSLSGVELRKTRKVWIGPACSINGELAPPSA